MVKGQFLKPVTVQCAIPFYCIFCLSVDTENAASLTDSSKTRLTLTFGQEMLLVLMWIFMYCPESKDLRKEFFDHGGWM